MIINLSMAALHFVMCIKGTKSCLTNPNYLKYIRGTSNLVVKDHTSFHKQTLWSATRHKWERFGLQSEQTNDVCISKTHMLVEKYVVRIRQDDYDSSKAVYSLTAQRCTLC